MYIFYFLREIFRDWGLLHRGEGWQPELRGQVSRPGPGQDHLERHLQARQLRVLGECRTRWGKEIHNLFDVLWKCFKMKKLQFPILVYSSGPTFELELELELELDLTWPWPDHVLTLTLTLTRPWVGPRVGPWAWQYLAQTRCFFSVETICPNLLNY